ncbi:MAG: hypothetical protein PHY73_05480 [Candidatus Omnitrophica bacterium]|nr:hypothetical protein [Candidatus Omnitrophota bacterium]
MKKILIILMCLGLAGCVSYGTSYKKLVLDMHKQEYLSNSDFFLLNLMNEPCSVKKNINMIIEEMDGFLSSLEFETRSAEEKNIVVQSYKLMLEMQKENPELVINTYEILKKGLDSEIITWKQYRDEVDSCKDLEKDFNKVRTYYSLANFIENEHRRKKGYFKDIVSKVVAYAHKRCSQFETDRRNAMDSWVAILSAGAENSTRAANQSSYSAPQYGEARIYGDRIEYPDGSESFIYGNRIENPDGSESFIQGDRIEHPDGSESFIYGN